MISGTDVSNPIPPRKDAKKFQFPCQFFKSTEKFSWAGGWGVEYNFIVNTLFNLLKYIKYEYVYTAVICYMHQWVFTLTVRVPKTHLLTQQQILIYHGRTSIGMGK